MEVKCTIQKFQRPPKRYSCCENCRHAIVKANGNDLKMKSAARPLQAVSVRWKKFCKFQHYSFNQHVICFWVQLPFRIQVVPAVTVSPTPASTSTLSSAACKRGKVGVWGGCLLAIKQTPAQITERRPSIDRYANSPTLLHMCSFRCSASFKIPQEEMSHCNSISSPQIYKCELCINELQELKPNEHE